MHADNAFINGFKTKGNDFNATKINEVIWWGEKCFLAYKI
jgi:hypothetical protein